MRFAKTRYRLRQFWRGLQATVTTAESAKAAGLLPPAAFVLFQRLPTDGQRHSFNVLASLEREETVPEALAAAALLHDVGKVAASEAGLTITLWWRGPLVLLETFAPQLLTRMASANVRDGWRYLLFVQQEHPRIGATWAAEAGCSELACWLIAHHQDTLPELALGHQRVDNHMQLLARLQRADNLN